MINACKTRYLFFLLFFFLFLLYSTRGIYTLDPDFGWHYKMGELIAKNGIPRTDPFSYTMPSYPFIDHEWLTNIGIYYLYELVGYKGLAVVFGLIATASLFLQIAKKEIRFAFVPLLFSGLALSYFTGIRPQVLSWFFFSLLLFLFHSEETWKHFRFFAPVLLLAWVNLHGGFALGVVTVILWILARTIIRKRLDPTDLFVCLLIIFVTAANPYGFSIWREIFNQMTESLRWRIAEWYPGVFYPHLTLWAFNIITFIFLFLYRKKITMIYLLACLLFFLMAATTLRHTPFWLIIAQSGVIASISLFANERMKKTATKKRFILAYKVFVYICISTVLVQMYVDITFLSLMQEKSFYPQEAVRFLQKSKISGHMLSVYNWGGYLIWKLPGEKVFIDGRMTSWRQATSPASESTGAFAELADIFSGKEDFAAAQKKYAIKTVLIPRGKSRAGKKQNQFISTLKQNNFIEVYKDNIAVVYKKK